MRVVTAARASALLYRVLLGQPCLRPILIPANVCPIVPITFLHARAPFQLVDIEPDSLEIDHEFCLDAVRAGRAGGVLLVRPYGAVTDNEAFFQDLKRLDETALIIDDRCLARPELALESFHSAADVTLFSTGSRKYVELGWGGYAAVAEPVTIASPVETFDRSVLSELEHRYRVDTERGSAFADPPPGWLDLSEAPLSWSEYAQAVGQALPEIDQAKRVANQTYATGIPEDVQLPSHFQQWRFNILAEDPHRLVDTLAAAGIHAARHYRPMSGSSAGEIFPAAERLHSRIVNLFNIGPDVERWLQPTIELVRAHVATRR